MPNRRLERFHDTILSVSCLRLRGDESNLANAPAAEVASAVASEAEAVQSVAEAEGMSEEALKTHWMQKVEENSYDQCPQGHIWFDTNTYYELHKDQPETSMGGSSCKLIIKRSAECENT